MPLRSRYRAAALALVLGAAAAAVVGGVAGGTTGLLIVVAAIQVLIALLVLAAWREVRRARRGVVADLRPELARALDASRAELAAAGERQAMQLRAETTKLATDLSREVAEQRRKTVDLLQIGQRKQYQQVEALVALYYDLRPARALPVTRTWAASPDLLRYLYLAAREGTADRIVECGSGASTLVAAYGFRQRGAGRVTALEHDPHYAGQTRDLLRRHGLDDWAEVVDAPLEPVELEGESWPWYQLSAVPAGPFDLILVDGPPGATRKHARYPAVPLLFARLAPGGAFVLDDYDRPEEHEVAERWVEAHPDLELEHLRHEKGTAVLRRVDQSASGADQTTRPS